MDKKIEKNVSEKHPVLRGLAAKYIWWKAPDEALLYPERVVAQVMDIGDYDDVQMLAAQADEAYLREVLVKAEIGQYSARSWAPTGITGLDWLFQVRFLRCPGDAPHDQSL
ncbi:MAG: hypothetical protein MUO63_03770 [Desulfobulbaceae bacterium]|nr:hypothetical protein [Desulfobulbaceae bacterium]